MRTASTTVAGEMRTVPMVDAEARAPLAWTAGFFFSFRICITYLAFQSNPRLGTIVNLGIGMLLLFAVFINGYGEGASPWKRVLKSNVLLWLALYLAVLGASVLWTGADSRAVAGGYWSGMVVDVLTVLLLLRGMCMQERAEALLRGFVIGSVGVAAIAWLSPTLPDLRIGNEEFLHPNGLGLEFALACLLAQQVAVRRPAYKWFALALGISLLRTISKTSIVAFLFAEVFFLLSARGRSRSTVLKAGVIGSVVVAAFWGLLSAYVDIYASTGDQAETLTGRTAIWATSFEMSLEHPWLGHGLYSFRALVPAFGTFQPWHAHNEWLQQFFEFGVCGVLLTAALYFALFRSARKCQDKNLKRLMIALVLFALLHGLTDTVNFGLSLPLWAFVLLALWHTEQTLSSTEVA